jgi:hypothetical protein
MWISSQIYRGSQMGFRKTQSLIHRAKTSSTIHQRLSQVSLYYILWFFALSGNVCHNGGPLGLVHLVFSTNHLHNLLTGCEVQRWRKRGTLEYVYLADSKRTLGEGGEPALMQLQYVSVECCSYLLQGFGFTRAEHSYYLQFLWNNSSFKVHTQFLTPCV